MVASVAVVIGSLGISSMTMAIIGRVAPSSAQRTAAIAGTNATWVYYPPRPPTPSQNIVKRTVGT